MQPSLRANSSIFHSEIWTYLSSDDVFWVFPELRPILDGAFEIFGDKSEYVVATPQYRAAANTAMGWLSRSRAQ
jgi:hypothetical protein